VAQETEEVVTRQMKPAGEVTAEAVGVAKKENKENLDAQKEDKEVKEAKETKETEEVKVAQETEEVVTRQMKPAGEVTAEAVRVATRAEDKEVAREVAREVDKEEAKKEAKVALVKVNNRDPKEDKKKSPRSMIITEIDR